MTEPLYTILTDSTGSWAFPARSWTDDEGIHHYDPMPSPSAPRTSRTDDPTRSRRPSRRGVPAHG